MKVTLLVASKHGPVEVEASQDRQADCRHVRLRTRLPVTPLEWQILELLAESPGKPVSSSHILIRVWGAPYQWDEAYLATYIWRLRQKIEPNPAHPMFLRTVPGLGYQLDAALAGP